MDPIDLLEFVLALRPLDLVLGAMVVSDVEVEAELTLELVLMKLSTSLRFWGAHCLNIANCNLRFWGRPLLEHRGLQLKVLRDSVAPTV